MAPEIENDISAEQHELNMIELRKIRAELHSINVLSENLGRSIARAQTEYLIPQRPMRERYLSDSDFEPYKPKNTATRFTANYSLLRKNFPSLDEDAIDALGASMHFEHGGRRF